MEPLEITIFNRAVGYVKANNKQQANQDFRLLYKQFPRSINVLVWLARTEQDKNLAKELLLKAKQIDPDHPLIVQAEQEVNPPLDPATQKFVNKMIFDRAVGLQKSGYKQAANSEFRKVLDSDANNVEALIGVADTEDNLTNAKYFLEFAGLVNPKHPQLKDAWKRYKKREK